MIDLHCHILPGLDDGPTSAQVSLAMARIALDDGITTVAATPHVRGDHPGTAARMPAVRLELQQTLQAAGLDLELVSGAEVAIDELPQLPDAELASLTLAGGPYLLVESPYSEVGSLLEESLFQAQVRGLRPVLAHPERSPCFLAGDRLAEIVRRGVLCSVAGGSLTGAFGERVRTLALELVDGGAVHDVSTDAHDAERRPPRLSAALTTVARECRGGAALADWLRKEAPAAVLAGEELPPRPQPAQRRRPWNRRR